MTRAFRKKLPFTHDSTVISLVSNTFWSMLSHAFYRGALVVSSMVMARVLDSGAFAAYAYFQLTIQMLAAYGAFGMGITASRYFAEIGNDGSEKKPPIAVLLCLSTVMALLAASMLFLVPETLLTAELDLPRWVLALGVFVLTMNTVPAGGIMGLECYREAALVSAISGLVLVVGVFYAAAASSALIGMLAITASAAVQCAGQSYFILRHVNMREIFASFSLDGIYLVLGVAAPMFLVSLLSASGIWIIGRLLLSGAGGEQSFSLYVVGMQWFSLVMLFPGILSRVIFPRLVHFSLSKDAASVRNSLSVVRGGTIAASGIAAIFSLAVMLLSPWIIELYGPAFHEKEWVLVAFAALAIIAAPANTIGNSLVAHEGQRVWLLLTLVSSSLLVSICYLSIDLAVWAAVIAQLSGYATLTFLAFAVARSKNLV